MNPYEHVLQYHERTKHDYHRYAAALGYLDWDNQPNPFRRFPGARLIELPLPTRDASISYDQIYHPQTIKPTEVSLSAISELFFHSLAISAWKGYGQTLWSLRVNPSSGNLHPTEGYLLMDALEGLHSLPGIYHYAPKEHGIECRTEFPHVLWEELTQSFPKGSFFVGLSSIHWREAWKYGERAYRYCQHDIGHALGALRISAAILGWQCHLVNGVTDHDLGQLLGVNRWNEFEENEYEAPDLLVVITPSLEPVHLESVLPQSAIQQIADRPWYGRANQLSEDHHDWEIIDEIAETCIKKEAHCDWIKSFDKTSSEFLTPVPASPQTPEKEPPDFSQESATQIVRQRRSAVEMDGKTGITQSQFYEMLRRVTPTTCPVPWDGIAWPTSVHLGIFLHRVEGLSPGIYILVRAIEKLPLLQSCMRTDFCWERPEGCPQDVPLFLLEATNVQNLAASVSCGQNIAGESAFSCGMIAEFKPMIEQYGAFWYRHLFWETGMIGQVLYLEAEAKAVRSTGIGCFFDNPVHEVFGLQDHTFQSLYHFTVGGPVEDTRLSTLPAYPQRVSLFNRH